MKDKPELSVIILNYNTKELLADCLNSVKKCENEVSLEVIVSDNASTDGSPDMVREKFPWVALTEGANEGFSKGNNRAKNLVHGEIVLFLNPDTVVYQGVFAKTVKYLKEHKEVGALTCKLVLSSGELDKDTRRKFPTPWLSFNRLILGRSKNYWYENIPDTVTHEVEAIQGAFFLTWKKILDKVGWYDEGYFFDGEDLDLCFQINKAGYKLVYYPEVYITHLKGVTKGKVKKWRNKVSFKQRMKIRLAGVRSMERFFKKNMWKRYPIWLDWLVVLGIRLYRIVRWIRVASSSY